MSKLWLTYAWKDNEDQDVDHVINELKGAGIEVGFDRAQLLAGGRLWQQITAAIADPDLDGLAIFVTEASLESEPCREELAYALDRALEAKGEFNLIGIFPAPIDRSLIPMAIKIRVYVSLTDPTWLEQISEGLNGERTPPDLSGALPYGLHWHIYDGRPALEVWPKSGRWLPALVAVPVAEKDRLGMIMPGDKGNLTHVAQMIAGQGLSADGSMASKWVKNAIDARTTLHVFFNSAPSVVEFGDPNVAMYVTTPPP